MLDAGRRQFITLLGGAAAAWPLAARAQQPDRMRRIGVLMSLAHDDRQGRRYIAAFLNRLQELGWKDGRVTDTIPIVFVQVFDPVGSGFVDSLARPGGNTTGFADAEFSMSGKLLEVLKEIAPHLRRVAVIHNPVQAPQIAMWHAIEAVAPSLGVVVSAVAPRDGAEIEHTIEVFRNEPGSGVIVLPNPITNLHRELLIALMARHRLPAVYAYPYFVSDGGLVSYGVDPAGQFRQAALYVDRILKGAKPADLPVQQPTKFQLAINLRTAKALGIEVPAILLSRADEVIE
jgi:ABC-type uncharacterized transport system substrate-binding protein